MSTFENRVTFRWLTDLSVEQVRGELSRLPEHTIVLYLVMFQDVTGQTFTPRQALDRFAPTSAAPIYGCYDTYLGHGIVGGTMVTFEQIGRKAAQLGMRILAGEDPQIVARTETHQPVPIFDWLSTPSVEDQRKVIAAGQHRPQPGIECVGAIPRNNFGGGSFVCNGDASDRISSLAAESPALR